MKTVAYKPKEIIETTNTIVLWSAEGFWSRGTTIKEALAKLPSKTCKIHKAWAVTEDFELDFGGSISASIIVRLGEVR
jgi:hypothetical protein